MDEQTFEDIETCGVERWLDEMTQELKSRTYKPQPVRRVYISAGRGSACGLFAGNLLCAVLFFAVDPSPHLIELKPLTAQVSEGIIAHYDKKLAVVFCTRLL